jgi:hypothetical protein
MGPRYPPQSVTGLLQGAHGMRLNGIKIHGIEESVTYQAILEEGRIKGMPRARQGCTIVF